MYQVSAKIEGIADFLFNRMTDAELGKFRAGQSSGDMTDEQRRKEAATRLYVDDVGLYLPAWTFKRVLLDGAHAGGFKLDRKPLKYRLSAVVFVQGLPRFERAGATLREADYLHECMGKIPPRTGKLTLIRRPALTAGWELTASMVVLDDGVPIDSLRAALDAAGLRVGVGAWRPEFGRFVVRNLAQTEIPQPMKGAKATRR